MLVEVVKSKLVDSVRQIEFPFDPVASDSSQNILNVGGRIIPVVQVCNTLIPWGDLTYLSMSVGKSFLPTLELQFKASQTFLHDDFPLLRDLVTIYIGNTYDKDFKTIKCDFEIIECETRDLMVNIKAVLFISFLNQVDIMVYDNMTSFEVVKKFCEINQLGFVTNVKDTSDAMTWLQCNETNGAFLQNHVLRHMWVSNTSIMRWFIDPWYNLVVCDMFNELNETPLDEEITYDWFANKPLDVPQKLILTNNYKNDNWIANFIKYDMLYNKDAINSPCTANLHVATHSMQQSSMQFETIDTELQQQSTDTEQDTFADWNVDSSLQFAKRDEAHSNVHMHWNEAAITYDWSKGVFDKIIVRLHLQGPINALHVCKVVNTEFYKMGYRAYEPVPEKSRRMDVDSNTFQTHQFDQTLNNRLTGKYIISALIWEYIPQYGIRELVECQRRMYPLFDVTKLK